jgi:hypothetical protein
MQKEIKDASYWNKRVEKYAPIDATFIDNNSDLSEADDFPVLKQCQDFCKKYERKLIDHCDKCSIKENLLVHDFRHLSAGLYTKISLLEMQLNILNNQNCKNE